MDYIRNEKGYSLLISLIIVLLFTVLGVSLIGMTLNGVQKNETREDIIQSTDFASKGIERITAEINSDLNNVVNGPGLSTHDFAIEFNRIVDSYSCLEDTENQESEIIPYSVCIESSYPVETTFVKGTNPALNLSLRKNIKFKSIGRSGLVEKPLYTTINIGASEYPEVLNYAVGAYKVPPELVKTNCDPTMIEKCFEKIEGEGNLFLNGGLSIEGDIKVDTNLITVDKGLYEEGSTNSSFASVLPQVNSDRKLFLGGKMYKYTVPSGFNYRNYVNTTSFSTNFTPKDDINSLFYNGEGPEKISKSIDIKPINFIEKSTSMTLNKNTANTFRVNNSTLSNVSRAQNTFLVLKKDNSHDMENPIFTFSGTNTFGKANPASGKFATKGTININGAATKFYDGAYINGNLNITGSSTISGVVYVNGELTIKNAQLRSDVIFYVTGNVTIEKSEILGINQVNRSSSLIIFAKGDINFKFISSQENEPSELKGYFYSEKTLEIYGIYSNIKINGGVSARKIILNSLRGDWYWFFPPNSTEKSQSRLQIIYDEDIIKNFSALQAEPWIDSISPPIEIERSFK